MRRSRNILRRGFWLWPGNPEFIQELVGVDDGSLDHARADLPVAFCGPHLEVVELAVERIEDGLGPDHAIEADGLAVVHVDRGSHGDLSGFAERLQRMEA